MKRMSFTLLSLIIIFVIASTTSQTAMAQSVSSDTVTSPQANVTSLIEVGHLQLSHDHLGLMMRDTKYAYLINTGHITVVDTSNPASPTEVAYSESEYGAYFYGGAAFSEEILYLPDNSMPHYEGGGLRVVDTTNPTSLAESTIKEVYGDPAYDIVVSGSYAYIASDYPFFPAPYDRRAGIYVLDIHNPAIPVISNKIMLDEYQHVGIVGSAGNYLYLQDGSELIIWSLANPIQPTEVNRVDLVGGSASINGDWLITTSIVGNWTEMEFHVYNLSDKTTPTLHNSFKLYNLTPVSFTMNGRQEYFHFKHGNIYLLLKEGNKHKVAVFPVSDPQSLQESVDYTLPISSYSYGLFATDSHIYLVAGSHLYVLQSSAPCAATEWYAQYYNGREPEGSPILTGCTSSIDNYWGSGSPYVDGPVDDFSIRWQRTIDFDTAGWYNFRAFTDDGVRLYVDGELIIDDWTARPFDERSAMKKLSASQHDIVVEYFDDTGEALAHLTWYRTLLCEESDSQCTPLVDDAMYQTPYHGPMGTKCPEAPFIPGTAVRYVQTFAGLGCNVTSIGMSLQHTGITVTPDKLNDWLSQGRYVNECTGYAAEMKAYQDFAAAPDGYASGKAQNLVWQGVGSEADAEKALRAGYPVLFEAWGAKSDQHFVLVSDVVVAQHPGTGAPQKTFGINDPHHSWNCWAALKTAKPPLSEIKCSTPPVALRHATTMDEEIAYLGNGGYSPIGYLKYRTDGVTPALQVDSNGHHVLLVTINGKKIGYDSKLQQLVNSMVNAMYFSPQAIAPDQGVFGPLLKRIYIPENANSKYQLFIAGADTSLNAASTEEDSTYHVTIIGYDKEQKPSIVELTGSIESGQIAAYDIDFSNGSELTVLPTAEDEELFLPLLQR